MFALSGVTKVQPIDITPETEGAVATGSGTSSRVSSARSIVSSMWAGSEEPDYDAFARARKVNLYGQVITLLYIVQNKMGLTY